MWEETGFIANEMSSDEFREMISYLIVWLFCISRWDKDVKREYLSGYFSGNLKRMTRLHLVRNQLSFFFSAINLPIVIPTLNTEAISDKMPASISVQEWPVCSSALYQCKSGMSEVMEVLCCSKYSVHTAYNCEWLLVIVFYMTAVVFLCCHPLKRFLNTMEDTIASISSAQNCA